MVSRGRLPVRQYSTRAGKNNRSQPLGAGVLTVFIADDSPPVAEMLTQLLSSPGRVEVIGVAGTEAGVIAAVTARPPDVIVLDLQLADGSGTNVIRDRKSTRLNSSHASH